MHIDLPVWLYLVLPSISLASLIEVKDGCAPVGEAALAPGRAVDLGAEMLRRVEVRAEVGGCLESPVMRVAPQMPFVFVLLPGSRVAKALVALPTRVVRV